MRKKKTPLTESVRFREFSKGMERALDEILWKYLNAVDMVVSALHTRVQEIAAHASTRSHDVAHAKRTLDQFDQRVTPWFQMAAHECVRLAQGLRRTTYTLASAGEAEAVGRALGVPTHARITRERLGQVAATEAPSGGSLERRIDLGLSRLKRDIVDAFHLSLTLESPVQETLDRLDRAFPKKKPSGRPAKVVAPIKEAKRPLKPVDPDEPEAGQFLDAGFTDPDTWDQTVADYLSENLPADVYGRSPTDKLLFFNVDQTGDVEIGQRYEWEVEQELTQDFVSRVRAGEVDAANENGITEFQWLAILDSKTDECCSWRDGLTTTEIEKGLDGPHSDDDCDSTVPPAHFNCRCQAIPTTDEMPEETPPDFGSFDAWLNSGTNSA